MMQTVGLPEGTPINCIWLIERQQPLPEWARYPNKYQYVEYWNGSDFKRIELGVYDRDITISIPQVGEDDVRD